MASQPIHCVPPTTAAPLRVVSNDEAITLRFSTHVYEARNDPPFLASPVQSPINQPIASKWLSFDGGWAIDSRTLSKYHWPSFWTSTAEKAATLGGPPSAGVTSLNPSSRATSVPII